MFKINYHIITIVALFCSLSIGILMGMSMGDDVIVRQQEDIIYRLENHFNQLTEENQELQEEKQALQKELQELQQARNQVVDMYNTVSEKEDKQLLVITREEPLSVKSHLQSVGITDYTLLKQENLDMLIEKSDFEKMEDYLKSSRAVIILGPAPGIEEE